MCAGDIVMEQTKVEETEIRSSEPGIKRKTHFVGKVAKTTLGGALIDIGQDKPGIVHISHLKEEPVNRVEDVLEIGQSVDVWVRRIDKKTGTIELTMIEPLALEWREIKKGMKLTGSVTRIERFGVFVEIGAERPGLIHISELDHDYVRNPHEVVKIGDEIDVQVLEVNRRKKQIRLSRKALVEKPVLEIQEVIPEEQEDGRPTPTAMEAALREAMKKNQKIDDNIEKSKAKAKTKQAGQLDDILSRTLENYSGPEK